MQQTVQSSRRFSPLSPAPRRGRPTLRPAIAALALGAAMPAHASVISAGGATYTTGNAPTSSSAWGPASDLIGGLTSADHLYQDWWWLRLAGASRESTLKGSGAIAPAGADQLAFSTTFNGAEVTARWTLSTPAAGQTRLTSTLTLTNTKSSSLSLSAFHYADIDVNGSWSDDVVTRESATSLLFSDAAGVSGASPYRVRYEASGSPTFAVGQSGSLITALTDNSVTSFTSTLASAASAPNDQAGSWQWNIVLAPGQSLTLTTTLTLVPAPPALAVVGGLGVLALRRRRR